MKILLFLTFLFVCVSAYSQKEITQEQADSIYKSIPIVDSQFEYTEVVQLDSSFKKDFLYSNIKNFYVHEFKSAKDVIQYDEKSEGKVIGKGNFSYAIALKYFVTTYYINFTLEIQAKDGKYRYIINNFDNKVEFSDKVLPVSLKSMDYLTHNAPSDDGKAGYRQALYLFSNGIQGIIADLKKAMVKKDDF